MRTGPFGMPRMIASLGGASSLHTLITAPLPAGNDPRSMIPEIADILAALPCDAILELLEILDADILCDTPGLIAAKWMRRSLSWELFRSILHSMRQVHQYSDWE